MTFFKGFKEVEFIFTKALTNQKSTVNKYFHAAKFLCIKPKEAYSRGLIFRHIPVNSICSIMMIFSFTSNFRASKALCKCAKICTAREFLHLQYFPEHQKLDRSISIIFRQENRESA